METFGVLYNTWYGGFGFSDAFALELGDRIGEEVGHSYKHYRYRDHPEAVKLFLEKGSEWSSGCYSNLNIEAIPLYLKKYYDVHEYDGKEEVAINFSHAIEDVTTKFLEDPTPEKTEWLREMVEKIKSSRDAWYKR
jgi:hypothetical protein